MALFPPPQKKNLIKLKNFHNWSGCLTKTSNAPADPQVADMFGGLAVCSLEAVVAKDGKEYIIEVRKATR